MADSAIVPYPDMPGDTVPSPQAMAVDQHNAEWAKTFEGGTTNLATRARHASDIRQYASDLEAQRQQRQSDLLATNKDAQNFYLRERALTLQEQKNNFDMADKRRKADAALALAPSMLAAKQAQTDSTIAHTANLAKQTELQARTNTHIDNVQSAVADAKMQTNDPVELDNALIAAVDKNHLASENKQIMEDYRMAKQRENGRIRKQEVLQTISDIGGTPTDVSSTTGFPGMKAPTKPEKSPVDQELAQLKSDLALGLSNQRKAPLKEQSQYIPGLTDLRNKIAAKESGPASIAPAKAASSSDYIKSKLGQ